VNNPTILSNDLFSSCSPYPYALKIDSKGRVCIPSDIRRTLGIGTGDSVLFFFSLSNGRGGVAWFLCLVPSKYKIKSTKDCGSFRPGSKSLFFWKKKTLGKRKLVKEKAGRSRPRPL